MNESLRLISRAVLTILMLIGALAGGPLICFAMLAAHICLKDKPAVKPGPRNPPESGGAGRPLAERLIRSRSAAEFIEKL